MNLKLVVCFLVVIFSLVDDSVGRTRPIKPGDAEEKSMQPSVKLPKKGNGARTKHLAYLMNFRSGKNSGKRQIKNIESRTYVVDTNKNLKMLRRDRLLAQNLIKGMIERGLLGPVEKTKPERRTNTVKERSKKKVKHGSRAKRFQADVHEAHHNRNAHRHNPHRFRDENNTDKKFEPHPGSRGFHDYTYDDASQSEEIMLLEQVPQKNAKHSQSVSNTNEHSGSHKKSCYNDVYKNVLEAFQDALKKQISSYKSCVCKHNKSKNKSSKGHKHSTSFIGDDATTTTTTTEIITTTDLAMPMGVPEVADDFEMDPNAQEILQNTIQKNGEDVVCFHRHNAIVLAELLRRLQYNHTGTYHGHLEGHTPKPFREDHGHHKKHHSHPEIAQSHGHHSQSQKSHPRSQSPHSDSDSPPSKSHHQSHHHSHGSHLQHNSHHRNSNDHPGDRVSRHYNKMENSEEIEPIAMPLSEVPVSTNAPMSMRREMKKANNKAQDETQALKDLMKILETLQNKIKTEDPSVDESGEAPKIISNNEGRSKFIIESNEISGSENSQEERSYAQFLTEELKKDLQHMFRDTKAPNEKSFQDSPVNSIQKSSRKNDRLYNPSRKVRQNAESSYEIVGKSENLSDESIEETEYQRSQNRAPSANKSSSDLGKKLSLAVEIPESSRGIVRKIKYELE